MILPWECVVGVLVPLGIAIVALLFAFYRIPPNAP